MTEPAGDIEQRLAAAEIKIGQLTRVVVALLEQKTIDKLLPAVEQQVRSNFQKQFADGGLDALLSEHSATEAATS